MRYEVKLACDEGARHRVLAALRLLPCALRRRYPDRVVQSVYLDTHEGDALADNLAGISERQKVRLRWYGEENGLVRAQLEVKRRSGGAGDKDVHRLQEPVQVDGAPRRAFVRSLERLVPELAEPLSVREPAQWLRYRRRYLATADGRLRVTLDTALEAFDQRFLPALSCRRATPLPPLLIVEVKAPLAERAIVEEWLQDVPLLPGRCSKFALAYGHANGPLPSFLGD